jgi:hypothetical protein
VEVRINPDEVEAPPLRGHEQLVIGIMLCDRPILQRWLDAFATLQSPVPMGGFIVRNPGLDKMREICIGRQAIVDKALKIGARYVFFLDDDVVLPSDALVRLYESLRQNPKARVIGGLYAQAGWTQGNVPAAWDETQTPLTSIPLDRVIRCAGVGSGCMLLDLSVLPRIPRPWFSFQDRVHNKMWKGDDVLLCDKVWAAGYEVLLDGRVQCDHLDARVTSSNFKGKSPYELRHYNGQYIDHAGNVLLRSQIEH